MKVYGAAPNLSLFERHVIAVLEAARLDYEKALPFVEVFLGGVFRQEALQAKEGQIFLPDVDEDRLKNWAEAGALLARNFFDKLGEVVRKYYLPVGSPLWADLERKLRSVMDYREEYLGGHKYSAEMLPDVAGKLFAAAILGQKQIKIGRYSVNFNYHTWRHWFYSLWGQPYEWGRIMINERLAEANEKLYHFPVPPSITGGFIVIQPKYLMEAHGFKVVIHPDQTVEYWR